MTKRIIALLLVTVITITLAACGGTGTTDTSSIDTAVVESVVENDLAVSEIVSESEKTETTKSEAGSSTESTASTDTKSKTASTGSTSSKTQSTSGTTASDNGSKSETTKPNSNIGNATNQSGKDNIDAAIDLAGLKIKKGKSVLDGLNFGGKTFTMAITQEGQYNTESFKLTVAAFEKAYNCKIKFETLVFNDYNQQIAQRLAAGKAPEICFVHGVNFPACAIDGMYEPLTDVISQGDIMDSNNPTAGGIDLNKTSYFVYDGEIYGTCNYSSCFPYVIYYNKKQMSDAGITDPRIMAEKSNKWTWEYIRTLGRKLTKNDTYFLSNSFTGRGLPLAFGAPVTIVKDGKYKENVSSKAYMEAMKFMQTISSGANCITEPYDADHAYNSYETLVKGKVYLWTEESSKYLDISKVIKTSTAFDRKLDNLGITSMPLGQTNTKKAYPTGWLTAVAAGKGTDPRVALAWDVFRSGYENPLGKGANEMNEKDQAFVDGLMSGNICCEVGCFGTSSNTNIDLTESGIVRKIVNGADVTQSITGVKDQITACIKYTIKK